MKRLCIILLCALAWAPTAHAATPFYEFNPDYAQSLLVASSGTVSEVFLPLNDYLSSFDVWVSNAGIAGDATFTLLNGSGATVATRTITVPATADSESGARLHIALPSQIAVSGTAAYQIQVASTEPTFRLYYADATKLLAHNGSPLPAYTGGLARIGGEDKGFSFKFALYETNETAPPVLTNVQVTQQNPSQATIAFNANEPVDRLVHYGAATLDWTGGYTSCAPSVEPCTAIMTVDPGTTYSYSLTVRDVWGNTSATTGAFTTLGQGQTPSPTATPTTSASPTVLPTNTPSTTPDTTAPAIANLRTVNLTAHSVGFAWTTAEAANSLVVVQIAPLLLSGGGGSDATFELEHFIQVDALDPITTYVAKVQSTDTSGNIAVSSISFQTPAQTPTPTPSPGASATPTATPGIGTGGPGPTPVVSWAPPPAGPPSDGYRIDVFDANNNLIKTIIVLPSELQASLGALPAGNNRVVVYADNGGVFEKVAAPATVVVTKRISPLERVLTALPYALIGIVLVGFSALGISQYRKRKTAALPPPTSPPTITSSR